MKFLQKAYTCTNGCCDTNSTFKRNAQTSPHPHPARPLQYSQVTEEEKGRVWKERKQIYPRNWGSTKLYPEKLQSQATKAKSGMPYFILQNEVFNNTKNFVLHMRREIKKGTLLPKIIFWIEWSFLQQI